MPDANIVVLVGRLCKDPEVKSTPRGTAVTELNLAINKKWKTEGGEDRSEVCYVPVTVWGKQAENCGKFVEKGSIVLVDGELKYEEWEKEGVKRHALKVTASRVQFLTFKDKKDDDEKGTRTSEEALRRGSSSDRPPF